MSLYYKLKSNFFPIENGYPNFIPQFRLECRSRETNNEEALEMRIADPLWMLGRQWQFGEFRGEDNGSPTGVRINYKKEKTLYYNFPGEESRRRIGDVPLEAKIEAVEVDPIDLRSRVRVGQKLEFFIEESYPTKRASAIINQLRIEFPLQGDADLDGKSRRFYNLMAGSVIDGGTLWSRIKNGNFPKGDFLELKEQVNKLKAWYKKLFVPADKETAWHSYFLNHKFNVHTHKDIELHAPDYQSGELDWYSFDNASIEINPQEDTQNSKEVMPIRVSFGAMPSKRLYEFEDSKLDLSSMEMEPSDLMRLMIVDFSMVTGSDWFTVPLEMELGELCWVNHLEIKDVFGISTFIQNDKNTGQSLSDDPLNVWDAFKIRNQPVADFNAKDHFLYLAPATTFRQESKPIEELLFLRDEYANMVWAIEKTVTNKMGKPTNGFDLHLELNGPFHNEMPEKENNLPEYKLASTVPTNWIPYLPFHIANSKSDIELRRAVMMRNEYDMEPTDIEPLSLLAQKDLLTIREEAIPRAGVRVQLTRQRVRWTDGNTYIWLGRKVLAGKGEGSSGLAFDQIKTPSQDK